MKFIRNTNNGIMVDEIKINTSMRAYLNKLCYQRFTTIDIYRRYVRKITGIKTNAPFYIRKDLILMPIGNIRNYEGMLVNYWEIKAAYNDNEQTIVVFKDDTRLILRINVKKMKKIVENVHILLTYVEK